jgi:hypothetical protein
MKVTAVSRTTWLGFGVFLILSGCKTNGDAQGIPPVVGDGGIGVDRFVVVPPADAGDGGGVRDSADANDAEAKDAVVDSIEAGETGDALRQPEITIAVDLSSLVPAGTVAAANSIVIPASFVPVPKVTVTVHMDTGLIAEDEIASVSASVSPVVGVAEAVKAKLAQSAVTRDPSTSTNVFIFADVPLDISKLATADYDLVVTATTQGGAQSTKRVRLTVDAGPVVVIKSPTDGGYYKSAANVELTAQQDKFAVTSVTMAVGQNPAQAVPAAGGGVYKTTLDFNAFSPPLEGELLVTFRVLNANGNLTQVTRKIVSDNKGPDISGTLPGTGDLIGTVIPLEATVSDPAGVMDASVVAVMANGNDRFEVPLDRSTGNTYRKLFDTRQLPSYALFPSVSFRARDKLGNESSVGYLVSLDNAPPLLDLDPPSVRRAKTATGGVACSWRFDPVGPDAVDDGALVTQLFDIRVRAEDEGNKPLTGLADYVPIGGVASVTAYVLDDTTQPLVVDTSDPPDGVCDDINPNVVPSTNPDPERDAQKLEMTAMPARVGADFSLDPSRPAFCAPSAEAPPKPFCETTYDFSKAEYGPDGAHSYFLSDVLSYGPNLPSIYAVPPIKSDKIECAGRQFDSSNHLKNGWACLSAKAVDKLGNSQVARPIRVCVQASKPSTGCESYQKIIAISGTDVLQIVTEKPLKAPGDVALKSGDEVIVSQVTGQTGANGRWKVEPTDSSGTRFDLLGSAASSFALGYSGIDGVVVPVAAMPDCTGTMGKGTDAGLPTVDSSKPCKPADSFPKDEVVYSVQ